MEIVGGAEVPEPDAALEGAETNGDSDVVEVIRTIESLEATEVAEAVTAERQVYPKFRGNRS